jgi:hypothetical protein
MIHYPLHKVDRIKFCIKKVKISVGCLGQVRDLYRVSTAIYTRGVGVQMGSHWSYQCEVYLLLVNMLSKMMSNNEKKSAYGVNTSQRERVSIEMTSMVCV